MTRSLAESLGQGHTAASWARDFLAGIGAPTSQQNIDAVVKWETVESGGGGGLYNPLNSVLGAPGATNVNSVGVKNYTSYQQGLAASIATFTQTQWAGVVNGFKANDPAQAQQALNAEYATWGGGPLNILGGAANVTGTAGATLTDYNANPGGATTSPDGSRGCIEDKPILTFPGGIPNFTHCNGRALLGGIALAGGTLIMVIGLAFIAANSRAGKAARAAVPVAL